MLRLIYSRLQNVMVLDVLDVFHVPGLRKLHRNRVSLQIIHNTISCLALSSAFSCEKVQY